MARVSNLLRASAIAVGLAVGGMGAPALGDETCQSPYMPKITGVEEFVYIWTLGEEGVGDGSDKLVTVDVRDGSETFGQVINSVSVGSRNEAHHGGFSDDRRHFWVGGLDTNRIYIFDVASDPSTPKLHMTIEDFVSASGGVVGPHTFYALPGRMMISGLSNDADHGGQTALVEYTAAGDYVATHWMPSPNHTYHGVENIQIADGYGYDVRALPRKNVMLTSSFTGWSNYMMDFGQMLNDPEAMKRFGNTAVVWDLHARQPRKVLSVPGVPLEIRFAWGEDNNWAFTSTALTSQLHLIYEDEYGNWQSKAVADIGDPSKIPLPVDISIAADDQSLWVDTFLDGTARLFDISDPHNPKQVYEKKIGEQLNMVSQSWDGERVYFTSSLLARWDKTGEANEQFLKAYIWDGSELQPRFEIDFMGEGLGRPHIMRFGAAALYES